VKEHKSDAATALEKKIDAIENGPKSAPGFGPVHRDLTRLFYGIESGDARPSDTQRLNVDELCKSLDADLVKWRQLNEQDLRAFKEIALPTVTVEATSGCGR